MNPSLLSVLLLAFLVTLCRSNSIKLGKCPEVPVLKTFDIDKFLGEWFVIQRFNPVNSCTKVNIKKDEEGSYIITEYSHPLGVSLLSKIGPLSRTSRKMKFPSDETEAIFKVRRGIARFNINTYGVVDTDYDSYAIMWGCNSLGFLGAIGNADIWSRYPDVDPKAVEAARQKLKELELDISPLKDVDHKECSGSEGEFKDIVFSNMTPEEGKKKDVNNMFPVKR